MMAQAFPAFGDWHQRGFAQLHDVHLVLFYARGGHGPHAGLQIEL
jgi:hypothetical protein